MNNNNIKPETTSVSPTPEVTKIDSKNAAFAAAPTALSDEDKKALGEAKQAASTDTASTR